MKRRTNLKLVKQSEYRSYHDQLKSMITLLSNEPQILVDCRLLSKYGPNAAIFLSNLIDTFYSRKSNGSLLDGEWFISLHREQIARTGIRSEDTIRKLKKTFVAEGVLDTWMYGMPSKEYYRIDFDVLEEILSQDNS